jgi:hypothetical protein
MSHLQGAEDQVFSLLRVRLSHGIDQAVDLGLMRD